LITIFIIEVNPGPIDMEPVSVSTPAKDEGTVNNKRLLHPVDSTNKKRLKTSDTYSQTKSISVPLFKLVDLFYRVKSNRPLI
jgi:hypothetical protein